MLEYNKDFCACFSNVVVIVYQCQFPGNRKYSPSGKSSVCPLVSQEVISILWSQVFCVWSVMKSKWSMFCEIQRDWFIRPHVYYRCWKGSDTRRIYVLLHELWTIQVSWPLNSYTIPTFQKPATKIFLAPVSNVCLCYTS